MFLLCYVDGEAIQQEGDKCFGVARCHGDAIPCAKSHNPMRSIALARLPSSRIFVQQDARMFNSFGAISSGRFSLFADLQPLRQLGDVRRDPPRLIARQQFGH